jgi:hypothetical protein
MYFKLGVSAVIGGLLIVLSAPAQVYVGRGMSSTQKKVMVNFIVFQPYKAHWVQNLPGMINYCLLKKASWCKINVANHVPVYEINRRLRWAKKCYLKLELHYNVSKMLYHENKAFI